MRRDEVSVGAGARKSTGAGSEPRTPRNRAIPAGSDQLPTGARHAAEVFRPRGPSDGGTRPERVPEGPYDAAVRFEVSGRFGSSHRSRRARPGSLSASARWAGPKQRLVLALLLAEPNTTVSVDRLIDGVWGEAPPESARHTLQSYVSELRKAVGEVIERDGTGYVLRVDRDELDALDFEARVSEGLALARPRPGGGRAELEAALALWRGRPFEDIRTSRRSRPRRLDSRSSGSPAIEGAVPGPARPRRHRRWSSASSSASPASTRTARSSGRCRCLPCTAPAGRPTPCARSRATRGALAEELGIDPSPRLRRLEEQILLQDPDLDPQSASPRRRPPAARAENPYMGLRAFREVGRRPLLRPGSTRRVAPGRACRCVDLHRCRRPERIGKVERGPGRAAPAAAGGGTRARDRARCSRGRSPSPSSRRPWRRGAGPRRSLHRRAARRPTRASSTRRHACSTTTAAACCSWSTSSRSCSRSTEPEEAERSSAALVRAADRPGPHGSTCS